MDPAKPAARGRGAILLEMFKKKELEKQMRVGQPGPSGEPEPVVGKGRAAILQRLRQMKEAKVGIAASEPPPPEPVEAVRRLTSRVEELAVVEPDSPVAYSGKRGRQISASANYIALKVLEDRGLYEYEVRFDPDVDAVQNRKKLVSLALGAHSKYQVYDSDSCLYLPTQLFVGIERIPVSLPDSGETVTVMLVYKRKKKLNECIHFYNVLFASFMRILQMKRMGRNFFDTSLRQSIPDQHLEVFPGYTVRVDEMEGGLMVCLDTQHKVVRTQTVHELLGEIARSSRGDFKRAAAGAVIGSVVMTRYRNDTYIIDDILWEGTPLDTFPYGRTGAPISYVDYFKQHHNLTIVDLGQPILVHRRKKLENGVETDQMIGLIPELCVVTGLTQQMRDDTRVMKSLAEFTRIQPAKRATALVKYLQRVRGNERCQGMLSAWGLQIADSPVDLKARVLESERVIFGGGAYEVVKAAGDWNRAVIGASMADGRDFHNWQLFYTQADRTFAKIFTDNFCKLAKDLGCKMAPPKEVLLENDRNDAYTRALERHHSPDAQVLVFIVSTPREDRYAVIKKFTCVQKPVASQLILRKTLRNESKVRTIVHKIIMQMICKLGGSLWQVHFPFQKWMIIGLDVYHSKGHSSVCGFVASLDDTMMRWFSEARFQDGEIGDFLRSSFLKALNEFNKKNGAFPSKVIVFRDGVGDGQLDHCARYELPQFHAVLREAQIAAGVTFVVIQKRINTRIYMGEGELVENPPNGTIVDSMVTKRNYRDFFMIPQSVRHGTVNPTHYLIVHDDSNIPADHVQRLAYKLCHMYYNWCGIVRVPAPCLYAHRLAALVGIHLKTMPATELSQRLFYL